MRFQKIDLKLPGSPKAASIARDVVRSLDELPPEAMSDLELLVSEVVGNSIRHSDVNESREIGLRMFMGTQEVRIEIDDPGPGFAPELRTPPPLDETAGRGLFLVDRLSDCWGVDIRDGTTVWFIVHR